MTQEGEEGMDEIPRFQEDRSRRPDSWIGEGGRESRKVDVQGPGKTLQFAGLCQIPAAPVGVMSAIGNGGGGGNTGFQVSSQAPRLKRWGLGEP